MSGMLYLCATPIGNLDDITFRVVETLKSVDVIAAEDTRNSLKLLNHFQIKTPMTSYHEYNRVEKAHYLIGMMQEGKDVALITDAGTPAISDPGETLVSFCHEAGIRVTSLPGAAACITGLTLSGLSTRRFCFEGFLPQDKRERRAVLEELARESRTIIVYEAPHHLVKTLEGLKDVLGNRKLTICRELTRGEYVLVIQGKSLEEKKEEAVLAWKEISIEEHMQYYEGQGIERKEAMKRVAKDRNIGKRDVYRMLLS